MATNAPSTSSTIPIATGCSGLINGYVFAISPTPTGSYTLKSTLANASGGTNPSCSVNPPTGFKYMACTVINNPPSIVLVGTALEMAGALTIQVPLTGNCKQNTIEPLTSITQPLSVIPARCLSQSPTMPCYAVLGISSSDHQYKIQYAPLSLYPSSSGTNNSATVTLQSTPDPNIHPILALQPNDISKLYVIGYPSINQIVVRSNSYQDSNQPYVKGTDTMSGVSLATPSIGQAPDSELLQGRALPTNIASNSVGGDMNFKLDTVIQNVGPAVAVGGNIVVTSADSLSVEMIPASMVLSSNTLPVTTVDLQSASSLVHSSSAIVGIDSLATGDSTTVWINYVDSQGNHIIASSNQPALFTPVTNGASNPNMPTTTTAPSPDFSANSSRDNSLSTGALAGIVVGCVIGGILLIILAFCLWRRRRRQRVPLHQRKHPVGEDDIDIALSDQHFLTEKLASAPTTYRSVPFKDDLAIPTSSDDEQDEFAAVSALASLTRGISNSATDDYYDPTTSKDTLLLESFAYNLHPNAPIYAVFPQGYATRSATRTHNTMQHHQPATECTIHYFPSTSTMWFAQLLQTTTSLQDGQLITYDAVSLSTPTKNGGYQYIWITSPYHLHHTLQSLIFGGGAHSVVDCTQYSFKAWSTLSMLKALQYVHDHGWIHRKINLFSFFYDQASTITDWHLSGFYQSKWAQASGKMDLVLDEFSAPEWTHVSHKQLSLPSMDIWSLGCVLYTVATGKRAFVHMDDYQNLLQLGQLQNKLDMMLDEVARVDDSYKELLRRMLVINPDARDSLPNLIHYWTQANELDDDDD